MPPHDAVAPELAFEPGDAEALDAKFEEAERLFDVTEPSNAAALVQLAAEGDEASLAILGKLTPEEMARVKAGHEAHGRAQADAEAEAFMAQAQATIARNRAVLREARHTARRRGILVRHGARHRRASRPAPVRRRGSRRSGSGSRAGPDDDPDGDHEPPAPAPGARRHHRGGTSDQVAAHRRLTQEGRAVR